MQCWFSINIPSDPSKHAKFVVALVEERWAGNASGIDVVTVDSKLFSPLDNED